MDVKKVLIGGGAFLAGSAVALGVTNPSLERYADYSTRKAIAFLEQDLCARKLPLVGNSFQDECVRTVQSPDSESKIRTLILKNTERQNYGLFSTYQTELTVQDVVPFLPGNLLPQYQVEILGVLTQFHTLSTGETEQTEK